MLDIEYLSSLFDDGTFHRGVKYHLEDYVQSIKKTDENHFRTSVKGSHGRIYKQIIKILSDGSMDNQCSCPMHGDCKHVVAALLSINDYLADQPIQEKAQSIAVKQENKLAPELEKWLDYTAQKRKQPQRKKNKEVVYIFSEHQGHIVVEPYPLKLLKKGNVLDKKSVSVISPHHGINPPQYFTPADIAIFQLLRLGSSYSYPHNHVILEDQAGHHLIHDIIRTGRAFWESYNENSPLTLSNITLKADLIWDISQEDGSQRLKLSCGQDQVYISQTKPPMAFVPKHNHIAPVLTETPLDVLDHLGSMPAVPPEDIVLFEKKLEQYFPDQAPRLPKARHFEVKKETVTPKAEIIFRMSCEQKGYNKENIPVVEMRFLYGDIVCFPHMERGSHPDKIMRKDGDILHHIERDIIFESKTLGMLGAADIDEIFDVFKSSVTQEMLLTSVHYHPHYYRQSYIEQDKPTIWASFLHRLKDMCKNNPSCQVVVKKDFIYGDIYQVDNLNISFEESLSSQGLDHHIDWFDMNIYVDVEGKKLPILKELIELLENNSFEELQKLPDNFEITFQQDKDWISISFNKLLPLLETIKDLHHIKSKNLTDEGAMRFNASEMMLLEDIRKADQAASLRLFAGEKLEKFAEKMRSFSGIEQIDVPKMLKATLRPYQYEGLAWLNFLREYGLSGILADDMGLGKTLQSLAWIAYEKEQGRARKPILVVAPTSLMYNWQEEAKKFTPDLKILLLHGHDRKERFENIQESDVILTTYPLLARDQETLLSHDYYALILDEAQNIKNPRAKATQILHQMKAEHRLCLTGTPMENHLGELWSLFHFLQPGLLSTSKEFNQFYRKEIEKNDNHNRQNALMRRLKPFMLRRTKEEVATELPPKTEFIRKAEFGKKQAKLYEAVRMSMNKKVRDIIAKQGIAKSQIIILDALLKMRQVCCHPELLKMEQAQNVEESAKLDMLMEMLPEMIEEGRKILLFSSFTTMLAKISERLNAHDIAHVELTGKTQKRADVIKKFQTEDIPIFLISLKAGGVGLNLTEADTVIHFDPWWNPAAEQQASDRAHRIGQDKPVFVYKLIMANSIEEKILELQQRKQKIADGIFDPQQAKESVQITQSEIQDIFNMPILA